MALWQAKKGATIPMQGATSNAVNAYPMPNRHEVLSDKTQKSEVALTESMT
jgi:hypothetical protein